MFCSETYAMGSIELPFFSLPIRRNGILTGYNLFLEYEQMAWVLEDGPRDMESATVHLITC